MHIFAWKLVPRTSKQVSKNLGPLWQPGVYNDTRGPKMFVGAQSTGGRAKPGQFGSLVFAMRHFGGESSRILAGKARKM